MRRESGGLETYSRIRTGTWPKRQFSRAGELPLFHRQSRAALLQIEESLSRISCDGKLP
jgi:hypothetical protein